MTLDSCCLIFVTLAPILWFVVVLVICRVVCVLGILRFVPLNPIYFRCHLHLLTAKFVGIASWLVLTLQQRGCRRPSEGSSIMPVKQ
jgi:hypothetical protein